MAEGYEIILFLENGEFHYRNAVMRCCDVYLTVSGSCLGHKREEGADIADTNTKAEINDIHSKVI